MDAARVYFLGISTSGSAARRAFPAWAKALDWSAELRTINIPQHSACEKYVQFVRRLREEESSAGAQVTSHKLRLYDCLSKELDSIDADADSLGEIGAIATFGGKMVGFSPDMPALACILPEIFDNSNWQHGSREVVILGAGGAGRAVALASAQCVASVVSRITLTELVDAVSAEAARRLKMLFRNQRSLKLTIRDVHENDELVHESGPGSLIVNATGMGKDVDGSPVTGDVLFPQGSIVWDLNYRGKLEFLNLARSQRKSQDLTVLDGWDYFVRNWFACLTRLAHIPQSDEQFRRFIEASIPFRT